MVPVFFQQQVVSTRLPCVVKPELYNVKTWGGSSDLCLFMKLIHILTKPELKLQFQMFSVLTIIPGRIFFFFIRSQVSKNLKNMETRVGGKN